MRSLLLALLIAAGPGSGLMAHELDWNSLLLASLKLRSGLDYDANVDAYMEVFRPDVWKRYRNDEFEMVTKRRETIELMKQAIASFSIEEDFVVRTSTRIGSYEFESKSFPLEGWSGSTYFYASHYPHRSFPSSIEVYMSNPNILKGFPMGEAQAKDFVRGRIDRQGDTDRTVYVKLHLRVTKVKAETKALLAEISKYSIYADQGYTKLLHSFDQSKAIETAAVAPKGATTPKPTP